MIKLQATPLAGIHPDAADLKNEKSDFCEWNPGKRWNPFNSHKLLSHVWRWKEIKRGRPIPPPVLVTIDPTNVCNYGCTWCNAEYIRKKRHKSMSEKALLSLAGFLSEWGRTGSSSDFGVEAVCVAGGGEPLLNPASAPAIDFMTANGIQVGLVTNGYNIQDFIDPLSTCTWVGVSVDAGRSATYSRLKNLPPEKNSFERVLDNISILVDYSRRHFTTLGKPHPAYGVSYKYLIYNRENISEIFQAAKTAKEIGCKNIHFRPAGTSWDKIGTNEEIHFSDDDIELFREQITMALELDDENFGVYGVTHKFNSQFVRANYFRRCYAIFMTAVFMPPDDKAEGEDIFNMGLCCDRRGDKKLELLRNIENVQDIPRLWGDKKHWEIHDRIEVSNECPRCTYQPHNEIYEQVILNDSMTFKFI